MIKKKALPEVLGVVRSYFQKASVFGCSFYILCLQDFVKIATCLFKRKKFPIFIFTSNPQFFVYSRFINFLSKLDPASISNYLEYFKDNQIDKEKNEIL